MRLILTYPLLGFKIYFPPVVLALENQGVRVLDPDPLIRLRIIDGRLLQLIYQFIH